MRGQANPPLPRLHRVIGRALARHCARRLAILPEDFKPTVSFTFDDFPASALSAALPILQATGMTATWYATSGLLGKSSAVGTVATAGQLRGLQEAGHEIGCHTHGHLDGRKVPAEAYGRDIDENHRVLMELVPGLAIRSFAYPFGGVTVGAKRAAMTRAVTCRSTMAGIARGHVDLALLPANPLYEETLDAAQDVIGRLSQAGGWAIFYTHDVAEAPSPWGCTPATFAAITAAVARAGLRVGTVGAVADQILRRLA
ncbi:polysaccharide deacetylase family protein [Methylobacterium sp. E-045]|uniref:polysaccharide deacetylase family protein n=1 Tax=Methylobacterium sp. E-045 TaxID=2836575 RepID=UPI001FB9C1EC|nr:polysaccharide deacetylase family protein [Methylobacterium sp. E-045]MCJ2132197.1 polysaccharide deacetylase family protein [Methylobacterium sp. E-045]